MSDAHDDRGLGPPAKTSKFGFQDVSGEYPRYENLGKSSIPLLSSGNFEPEKESPGVRSARKSSQKANPDVRVRGKSKSKANPRYPRNAVTQTSSGHIIEVDDTPGYERLSVKHRTGTRVTIYANGDVETEIKGSEYKTISSDSEMIVRGQVTVIIESDANLKVQGDCNLEVDGDLNQLIQGDHHLEILGNETKRVHGNVEDQVSGGRLVETRGNAIHRNLSNLRERTVGDATYELGGTYNLTTEGEYRVASYGQIQARFHGGFVTLNGEDAEGELGTGSFAADTVYVSDLHGDNAYLETSIHTEGSVFSNVIHAETDIFAANVEATTFEGTAKRADFATTAGAAPTGSASPTTPSPTSPTAATGRDAEATSSEPIVDVLETSDDFIINLDRSTIHGYNKRILNTNEVTSRARNSILLNDAVWLRDQVDTGAVLESIISSPIQRRVRETGLNRVRSGSKVIGNTSGIRSFTANMADQIQITIPEFIRIQSDPLPSTRLSPNFLVSHMLAGDSEAARLQDQIGLSKLQIAQNLQFTSYALLEKIQTLFGNSYTISEGLYNPFENEMLDQNSFNYFMAQGLGVGIQFPQKPKSFYYDAVVALMSTLTFHQMGISYIDYDPMEINEPTLLLCAVPGKNDMRLFSEMNHRVIDEKIIHI